MPSNAPFRRSLMALALVCALVLAGCSAPAMDAADAPGGDDVNGEGGALPTGDAAQTDSGDVPSPQVPTPSGDDTDGPETRRVESAPGAPVRVTLELADAAAFFAEGSRVDVLVTGGASDALRAGLVLPEGVEHVEGPLTYEGGLREDETVRLTSVLRAAPGAYVLRAWAEVPMQLGSRAAPAVLLAVEGDETSAATTAPPLPAPMFSVALEAEADAPQRVLARISAAAAASARLAFIVPSAFATATGTEERSLSLDARGSDSFLVDLGAAESWGDGAVALTLLLYPDAAVDGRLYSDVLYYWWHDGALVVGDAPPHPADPGGEGASGATRGGNGTAPEPSP